jgi:glutathione peroxidase
VIDMTKWARGFLLAGIVAACVASAQADEKSGPLGFTMKSITGQDIDLAQFKGKVVLIVNVASQCGLTPQYEQLQAMHEKYGEDGLAIIGVPCNQFGGQEPGSAEEIQEFCKANYGVTFDLLAKVDVNGDDACPLYKHLTALETKPAGPGKISWNFEKFLLNRDGEVIARFEPKTRPDDEQVIKEIEAALKK